MSTATTPRGFLGNLPAEVTSFVGRRAEVTLVRRMLSSSRLVTLTGAGGVGKTRLALRVGAEMRRAFPDGVWLVELAELRDPDLLAVAVAEALGIREQAVGPGAPGLAEFLADQRILLILDNCEQLVAACAELTETLLRTCPELRVLATSRHALRLAGEATLSVQPLSVPDPETPCTAGELDRYESASLLVERATAADPAFAVTDGNCATIARLCQALEGVPLAIELAAARLRVLSLDQLLDRLTDRFRLLTSGTRDAPPRQQTLRALIDWSWDLCAPAERALWSRLSVFSGGLELDSAEQVCADDELPAESILDLIASLVDKSVLSRSGDGQRARYRMLEVVREYGALRLAEAGEQRAVTERHCRWFAELAAYGDRHWVSPDQAALMLRLRQEKANLRVALEYAVTAGPAERALRFAADLENHWFVRGFLSEGRHWLDRALAMPAPRHWTRVKALRVAAWIATIQDDRDRAQALLADARELAEQLPRSVELAYIPLVEGNIALFSGDHATALPLFEQALGLFRELRGRSGQMWTLAVLGLTRGLTGSPADGYADLVACRDMGAASGEVWWRSFALWALSVLRWRAGDDAGASEAAKESLEVQRFVAGEQFTVGLSLESLAWIAGSEGRDQRAAQLLGASDRMWRAMHTSLSSFRSLKEFHDECATAVRGRLGRRAFEAALRRGAEWTPAEAVAAALEQPGRVPMPRTDAPAGADFGLTRREREVAALIAEGLTNREIAARLVVAQRTAEGHVENILSKLGFTSRAQVAGWLAAQQQPGAAS
ncbi:non-specific serine/threonine protein kinase [Krasilnikovia cinnamomea]|uniref:Non-specific serine/threonine protein kinase n=1 Tax=Krasilnikovia cinnamomea TaxID=349313 RepID=A0A4Q7ZGH4_9ACTN|nr:LuxR C-terminal-related transcriptional regulator [Krasilnikovia cinnamomea]RZU49235.1 non-specific serine/threonine protein kinase [Krasilnikovia cinnamomea]